MGIYQIAAPASEPLTLLETKAHLNVTTDADDVYILGLIAVARAQVEDKECGGLQLLTGTYAYKMDASPSCSYITIPRAPLISVTGVTYIDGNGVLQTFGGSPVDKYSLDCKSPHVPEFGEIHLAYNESWPSARSEHNAVRIQFTCGFGSSNVSVPSPIKAWMKLLIGTMYSFRESEVTGVIVSEMKFADGLLDNYRIQRPRVA